MRKILILPTDFYPMNTGFANATLNLLKSVNNYCKDIEIHIITDTDLKDSREIELDNIIRYNKVKGNNLLKLIINSINEFSYIKKYIIAHQIDLILLETNTFPILQNLLVKEFKDKLAVRIHSTADTEVLVFDNSVNIIGRIIRKTIFGFMKNIKYVIFTNQYHMSFVKKHFYKNNVYTIWTDKEYFILPNTCFNNVVNECSNSSKYILTLGKMSENGFVQKGLQDVIKAVYILKKEVQMPLNFELKIIGDGLMREKLIRYANTLGVQDSITFIKDASHDDCLGLIKNACAIILLSRYEGQSMFITEALSLGKPLIITCNNGMSDLITNNENGIAVHEGDYINAAQAMKYVYELSEDDLNKMGSKSYKIYCEKFSSQIIANRFSTIVDMIIANNQK